MLRHGGSTGLRGPMVVCALILVSILGAGCATDSTSAAATPSVPTSPTATPRPGIKENTTVLGGAVYAFTKKFGNSGSGYRNGWDNQGPYGVVWTEVRYDGDTSGGLNNFDEQSKARVKTIENTAQDNTPALWTVSQADAICKPFLPPDAQYKGTTTLTDTAGGVKGIEKRYTSALLVHTLPATDFTDVNGHAVAPGTFYVYYDATYNGSPTMLVDWCVLSTDENDAQNL